VVNGSARRTRYASHIRKPTLNIVAKNPPSARSIRPPPWQTAQSAKATTPRASQNRHVLSPVRIKQ
jgi:hypothetical protein